MVSLQYRLLHIETEGSCKYLQARRIGTLAFTTTIFLHVAGIPSRYLWLTDEMKQVLKYTNTFKDRVDLEFRVWLLFVAGITGFHNGGEHWLKAALSGVLTEMKLHTWHEVKLVLKAHLWVDILHNGHARKIFESAEALRADS